MEHAGLAEPMLSQDLAMVGTRRKCVTVGPAKAEHPEPCAQSLPFGAAGELESCPVHAISSPVQSELQARAPDITALSGGRRRAWGIGQKAVDGTVSSAAWKCIEQSECSIVNRSSRVDQVRQA